MVDDSPKVWARLALDEVGPPQTPVRARKPVAQPSKSQRLLKKLQWLGLDFLSVLFWAYIAIKVLFVDPESWLVSKVSPSAEWVLSYRFLVVLVALTVLLNIAQGGGWLGLLYIACFPLVVLGWKIPRRIFRRRSWTLAIGYIHVLSGGARSLRYVISTVTVLAISAALILVNGSKRSAYVAIACLLLTWLISLVRALVYSMSPLRFIEGQRNVLASILGSSALWGLINVDDDTKTGGAEKIGRQKTAEILSRLTTGLAIFRFSHFWASRLDAYRRTGVSILFSALAVVTLIAEAAFVFGFANLALYRVQPEHYSVAPDADLGPGMFIWYGLSAVFVSEISAISPKGEFAAYLSIAGGFSGAVMAATLALTLITSVRQARSDEVAIAAIASMRKHGDDLSARISSEYGAPISQLQAKVLDLGWGLATWIVWLANQELSQDVSRSADAGTSLPQADSSSDAETPSVGETPAPGARDRKSDVQGAQSVDDGRTVVSGPDASADGQADPSSA